MSPHRAIAAHPARILIVDDDENNRTLLEVMLAPEAFQLQTASSGEEALAMVAQSPPDLILLDVLMPGMGGYDVASILKGDVATRQIPIIMITALDDRVARLNGLAAGAEDFLNRPLDRAELAMRVRNLLRLKVASDGAVAERDTSMGMVNHDLRNLLHSLGLDATLLARDAPPQIAAGLERILGYVARMTRLVDDLVDVASLDAGRVAIVVERNDAVTLIEEIVTTAMSSAAALGLTIQSEIAESTLVAKFDRDRILQVLTNLVTNALKFTPRGGTITVRGKRTDGGLRISVRDTGIGIPSDMLETVFERFTQVKEHDSRGTGLGLYIAQCIVRSHGGRMWIESTLGTGSTFYFTIPSPREAVVPATRPTSARVLIIDDDPAMGETLALYLNRGGFVATSRVSAGDALALLESTGFDVLVTDLNMDGMTGLDLCERVAMLRPGLPVILTSGFGSLETQAAARSAGAYAFLSKPIDLQLLRVTLDRALQSTP